ncbi:MAG: bacteriohemerythrin [Candidatus Accumulibacter sp. UW26]|jgi:hemerythrin
MSATDLIQWSDDFSVHIPEIDQQHQVLVSLLNQLHRAIRERHGKATSREILNRLAEYTRTHFALEERLMGATHYPGLELHRQQHQDLMEQVDQLQHKLNEEGIAISFELLHFLRNWLVQHINDSDKRFGAHFEKVGVAGYAGWPEDVGRTIKKKKWWKFW